VIRVNKPAAPPAVLLERGAEATRALWKAFDASPEECRAGTKLLSFNATIYGHDTVVAALTRAQHGKCCFCERRTLGDVEHFRPKGGWQQADGDPIARPGYFWLAYDWANLYYACGPCNQRFKRNLFPLLRPEARARSHHDDLAAEEPLLLDPGTDDPAAHIGYREEIAHPLPASDRGTATIEFLRLNREDLREARSDQYKRLLLLIDSRTLLGTLAARLRERGQAIPADVESKLNELRDVLASAASDRAEFAAMARVTLFTHGG